MCGQNAKNLMRIWRRRGTYVGAVSMKTSQVALKITLPFALDSNFGNFEQKMLWDSSMFSLKKNSRIFHFYFIESGNLSGNYKWKL